LIARLRGGVAAVEPDAVIVDVGGVCYRVHMSGTDLGRIGAAGLEVAVHTYLHVRDSELTLYGSLERATLDLFQAFLTVSGVGPRVALALVGSGDPDTLRGRVEAEDVAALTRVPGVGKKTAQRIILDLKGKLPSLGQAPGVAAPDDAVAALVSLGYSAREAADALSNVEAESLEERIRGALKALAG
jgi:holliday junction DNA helicase RuvA